MSLKILQVNTSDRGGGAEGSAWNLFKAYQTRGHASWLAVGRKRSGDPNVFTIPNHRAGNILLRPAWWLEATLAEHVEKRGAARMLRAVRQVTALSGARDVRRGIENFNFPGTWKLLDATPQRPDLIHCHNLHGDYFDLRALPWLSQQVPVILNLRDAWLLSGHCAHSLDCERWRTGCGNCPYLDIYPAVKRDATDYNWQRKRDIYQQSRLYITAPSQWLMDRVHDSMLQGVGYRVIPNGIDLTRFAPGSRDEARTRLSLPQQAKIVLFDAHSAYKDFETVVGALDSVEVADTSLIFICLGRLGEDRRLGDGRLVLPGFVGDPDDLVAYYHAADVYVHAAKAEAFGKSVTEAMACGLPVVATAVGGIPEQIIDGQTGLLVAGCNAAEMAFAIEALLSSDESRRRIGHAAHREASKRYGLDRQANEFLDWYGEILEDWKSA